MPSVARMDSADLYASASLSSSGRTDLFSSSTLASTTLLGASAFLQKEGVIDINAIVSLVASADVDGEAVGSASFSASSLLYAKANVALVGSASLWSDTSVEVIGTTLIPTRISIISTAVLSAYGSTGKVPECVYITDFGTKVTDKPEIMVTAFDTTVVVDFEDIIHITDEIQITDCG